MLAQAKRLRLGSTNANATGSDSSSSPTNGGPTAAARPTRSSSMSSIPTRTMLIRMHVGSPVKVADLPLPLKLEFHHLR